MRQRRPLSHLILCLLLVACTLLLCACPATPPTCTHNYEAGVCTLCGEKDPDYVEPEKPQPGGDDVIYGNGNEIKNAGDSIAADAPVLTPATYEEAGAKELNSGIFFRSVESHFAAGAVIRAEGDSATRLSSTTADGKTFDGKGSVLLFPTSLLITAAERLTLRNMVIVGDVAISDSTRVTFENVEIVGNVTVDSKTSDVLFSSCRLTGATPLTLAGSRHGIVGSYIGFTAGGLVDKAEDTVVKNCRFVGSGTAITAKGVGSSYTYCSLTVGEADTGVCFEGTQNAVAGMNVIRGTQRSVLLSGVRNVSVVKNSMVSVTAENCHAIYVCDNEMGGRLEAKNNDYILADGNAYPADEKNHIAVQENNTHPSGDTLLDVDERLEVGVNEALLPQVDKELFVGMPRKETMRAADGQELDIYRYLVQTATENEVVILTPGCYSSGNAAAEFGPAHSHTTVYGYGVYVEAPETRSTTNYPYRHLRGVEAEDLTFKGLTFGCEQQSCGQVYVLKKLAGNKLQVVTGAGMFNEFADSTKGYFDTVSIGIQRAGTFHAIGDFSIVANSITKNKDGTMTLTVGKDVYDLIEKGDIMTCRLVSAGGTCSFEYCKDISFKDITVYGNAGGMAFYEGRSGSGTQYYRVYDTTKNGPIIDEETYLRYTEYEDTYGVDLEISIDAQNRYRGSLPHISSIDATNVASCTQGAQVTSCLFENMCDDGSNQNAGHARLSEVIDNGDGTTTLIYKGNLSAYLFGVNGKDSTFSRFCQPFREGDRVYIYTSNGQLFCDTPALTAAVVCDPITSTHPDVTPKQIKRYAVTVATKDLNMEALEGYDLTDDHHGPDEKVIVDNRSQSSNGFKFDNSMVQNTRSRGFLLKGSDGLVTNCTFRNIAKVAIALIYEIQWGESSASENVRIEKNLIENTSYSPGVGTYHYVPINIMGLGEGHLEDEYLLYNNIYIEGNVFVNRNDTKSPYAIYVQSAKDIFIRNNDFGCAEEGKFKVLWLNCVRNVELSGNLYPPYSDGMPKYYVEGEKYVNIYGDDVGDAIPDNP